MMRHPPLREEVFAAFIIAADIISHRSLMLITLHTLIDDTIDFLRHACFRCHVRFFFFLSCFSPLRHDATLLRRHDAAFISAAAMLSHIF